VRRWRWLVAVATVGAGAVAGWMVFRDGGTGAVATPTFVDETADSGIDQHFDGEGEFFEGGGLATFDCDGNGLPDLYIAGGSNPAGMYRNVGTVGGPLRFERLPSPVTDLGSVTGAYPIDLDSDGVTDLAVLRHAEGNAILRGLGDCTFEDATAAFGIDPGDAWTTAFSATWEGDNVLPTIVFGNYRVPDTIDCATSVLLRPDESSQGYGTPTALTPGYCTLSVLFADWDHAGRADLRMANDRNYYRNGSEQLWRVEPGAPPRLYTEADGWRPLQIWGMGIASQDVTGDGVPEVFLTSQGDNKLQSLDDGAIGPTYRDIALQRGVTATRPYTGGDVLPSTAWHPEFADVNNDGLADLYITKGNVDAQHDYASKDPDNLLIARRDGTFVERGEQAGIASFERSRGASVSDLNLDGLLDIVVVNRVDNVTVLRNVGVGSAGEPQPMGHWLALRLLQAAPNVDAIGAWVEVRTGDEVQHRQLTIGGGHASGESGWLHVGLGDHVTADVRVQWPDGSTGAWMTVDADGAVVIDRTSGTAERWRSGD